MPKASCNPENHPILECPPCADAERIRWLEMHLAMLWDQVWWLSLKPEIRAEWEAKGFSSPIQQFYGRDDIVKALRGR